MLEKKRLRLNDMVRAVEQCDISFQKIQAISPKLCRILEANKIDSTALNQLKATWDDSSAAASRVAIERLIARLPNDERKRATNPESDARCSITAERALAELDISLEHLGRLVRQGAIIGKGRGESLMVEPKTMLEYKWGRSRAGRKSGDGVGE